MTRIFRHGTVLLKIGLVIAIAAMIISNSAWHAEVQAQEYAEFYAQVHCEAPGGWWGSYTLWSYDIGVVGDSSKCEERIDSAYRECSGEDTDNGPTSFYVDQGCTQL